MLSQQLLDELRLIAFCDKATAANRVSACRSLSNNSSDINRVIITLNDIALAVKTPDSVRIKAIDLLDKISNTGTDVDQQAVDVDSVKTSLLSQYTGCQKN